MTTVTVPSPGTYSKLNALQQKNLWEWRENVQKHTGPVGLWVYGDRGQGSTYVASVAVKRLYCDGVDFEYIPALALIDMVRRSWFGNELVRTNPNDYDLFAETLADDEILDDLWDAELLWVDDLHDTAVDMAFWRRHIQERLVNRVKMGMPTVIATSMYPRHRALEGLELVIETRFVTCYAER